VLPPIDIRTMQVAPPAVAMSDASFRSLRDFIYERLGIYFQEKKKYLLEGRLGKRVQLLRLDGYDEYLHLLRYGAQKDLEFEYLCDAVTINETFFFRNEPQFDALETVVLPELFQARRAAGSDTVRVWSAACSSGEEPYTLAMIFQEKLRHRFPGMRMEIVGTDISPTVLHAARKGSYGDYATRNTPPHYLQRYFTVDGPRRTVKDEIRAMVRFQHLNLFERGPMRSMRDFDLVLCRNVMIYFDTPAKVQVVSDLYDSLRFGGYLVIGYSELLHGISNAFRVVSFPKTTLYKKER
jgi:chemotaxis protein methyltransferase CheR